MDGIRHILLQSWPISRELLFIQRRARIGGIRRIHLHRTLMGGAWIITFAALATLMVNMQEMFKTLPLWAVFATAMAYIVSHTLRAIRLALLATPIIGISARSAILLHLVTAPISLLLPLKLGEIFRFQQLHALGSGIHWSAAVIVLLLDRILDAFLIVVLFLWLISTGNSVGSLPSVVVLAIFTLGFAVMTFGIAPVALTTLQKYIIVHHQAPAARRALGVIDRLRNATTIGAHQVRLQAAMALALSAAIWAGELLAMFFLLAGYNSQQLDGHASFDTAASLLLSRAASEWSALFGFLPDPAVRLAACISLTSLLVLWPFVLSFYLRRRCLEPMRNTPANAALEQRSGHGM